MMRSIFLGTALGLALGLTIVLILAWLREPPQDRAFVTVPARFDPDIVRRAITDHTASADVVQAGNLQPPELPADRPPPPPRRRQPPPPPPGLLKVVASPWARIYVDGQYVANTPRPPLELPAGSHTIELRYPGPPEQKHTCQVQVRREQPAECQFNFRSGG